MFVVSYWDPALMDEAARDDEEIAMCIGDLQSPAADADDWKALR